MKADPRFLLVQLHPEHVVAMPLPEKASWPNPVAKGNPWAVFTFHAKRGWQCDYRSRRFPMRLAWDTLDAIRQGYKR